MKILVPLDGSKDAEDALSAADRFLRFEETGTLLLQKVLNSPTGKVLSSTEILDLQASEAKKAELYLQEIKERFKDKGYEVETHISAGPDPAQAIADWAETQKADLIIMRSHGISGIRHFLLGSVAYRLVRLSDISVLLVKAKKSAPVQA